MRRPAALAVLLGVALGGGFPTHAAKVPDWARGIAETAPALDITSSSAFDSRVLLSDTTVTVLPDGTFRTLRRLVHQNLRPGGGMEMEGHGFGMNSRVKTAKVWHLPPGERVERSDKPPVEITDLQAFETDRKMRVVGVDGVRPGSLVFYEFEAEDKEPTLDWSHLFYEGKPVREATFRLRLPPGWTERHAWVRGKGPEARLEGATSTWTLRDLEPGPQEKLAPEPAARAPLLALTILPPPGTLLPAVPLEDWRAAGAWYDRLTYGRHEPTAGVQAAVREALQPVGPDPYARIRASSLYVRDRVRYIARAVGIGGLQPHQAQQVADELVGDCKDKGTLLRAMLAVDGRRAYPLIVNLTTDDTVSETVPSLAAFNHFVLAVELPSEAPVPKDLQPSVLDGGDLGKLLVIDTTNEHLSPGAVSADLAGKRALLVAGERSRLVTLPGMQAGAHGIARAFTVERQPDGGLRWRRVTRTWGEPATTRRGQYRRSPAEARRDAEAWAAERWPGARVQDFAVEPETAQGEFVETVAWTSPASATLDVFPGAEELIPRVSTTKRTAPVAYPHPVTLRYTCEIHAGTSKTLDPPPAPVEASGQGWHARRTMEKKEGHLEATWEATVDRVRYGVEDVSALKELWSGLRRTSAVQIELGD